MSIFPSDPIGVSHGAGTEPTPQSLALTPHLIHANDRSVATLSPDILGFESFVPELRGLRPEALLRALSERYREDPSVSNSLLLQHAINRLTNTGPVGEHLRKEIDKAIEVLHHAPSRRDEGANADDIFYWAYADASFRGASMFGDLPSGWIYWRTPYVGDAMNDVISSLTVTVTSNEVGGNVALFQDAGFVGKYQNYGVTVPPGINGYVQEDVSFVGDDFNDIASSILAIRRFASETRPVSISGLIKPGDITAIVNQFSGISPAGDATITWDLWPTGPTSSHDWHPDDPAKRFIYVLVPITVHTPAPFPDTFAQIRYWVYLYVDDSGRIQGFTEYWGYYVSSCCFLTSCITNDIANALAARIPGTIGQVNALVANAVAVANTGGPYRFTYFLPGKGQFTGSTWDDVTVVAVKR
ncbi:MAG TPA: hypothetical protein VHW23_34770 [Kofleriaceae bacterium]|nr:hypothetical protein [Kofleriaceae bacterium]